MSEFNLYSFAQSGNAYKAALMLNLCGADWSPRFVDYFNGETRTPVYRAINVMGEVPVLEHAGRRMTQSGVILDYLAEHFGKFRWNDDDERREVLRWLLFDNHKLTSYTATWRYMLAFTDQGKSPVAEAFGQRARGAMSILNAHLQGKAFALGEKPTIADLSMCGYMFFNDEFGVEWTEFPNIGAWLARIRALPGWQHPYQLLPGHPLPAKR